MEMGSVIKVLQETIAKIKQNAISEQYAPKDNITYYNLDRPRLMTPPAVCGFDERFDPSQLSSDSEEFYDNDKRLFKF